MYAAAPVDEVQENLEAVRRGLWVGVPLLVAAVAAVAWHLVGRALRPVEAIRAEVAAIGGTTIHRRVPTPGTDDEIGRLAHTMNAMLDRLEAASTRQRQFVSDASHELRSPIAAIRTDVEVTLPRGRTGRLAHRRRHGPGRGGAARAPARRPVDAGRRRRGGRDGCPGRADERIDVGDLVADVAARPRRVPVRWERAPDHADRTSDRVDEGAGPDAPGAGTPTSAPAAPGGPVVSGRPDALSRLLTNLVDNAARHATTTVDVRVDVASSPTGTPVVHLAIDDDGPGDPGGRPAADLRAVHPPRRRARTRPRRRRPRSGGRPVGRRRPPGPVWVGDSPTGGARFVVELPAAPAAP